MTLSELCALYFSRTLLEALSGTPFRDDLESAFEKLSAGLAPHMKRFLDQLPRVLASKPDPMRKRDDPRQQRLAARLLEATLHLRQASITYHSQSSDRTKVYLVHPYRLAHAQGGLYLLAYVPEYAEIRTFALERILEASLLEERFTPIEELPDEAFPHSLGVYSGQPERVEVEFQPSVAEYVGSRAWHHSQHTEPVSGGGLRMTLEVCVDRSLQSWILSFGQFARVVSPEHLARAIAAQIDEAVAQYRQPSDSTLEFSAELARLRSLPRSPRSGHRTFRPLILGPGRRIVAVGPPGRVVEVKHAVSVVRHHRVVERQRPDGSPVAERAPLAQRRSRRLSFIGEFHREGERPLWRRVAPVEDLRHHFVPEIDRVAGNPRMAGPTSSRMNVGARVGCRGGLPSSATWYSWRMVGCVSTDLKIAPVAISVGTPPPRRSAVVSGAFSSSMSLMNSVSSPPISCCVMKLAVRSGVACSGSLVGYSLPTTLSIACGRGASRCNTRSTWPPRAPRCRVRNTLYTGVGGNPPSSDQADAVGMQETAESLAVEAPPQVGAGIDGSLGRLAKDVTLAERKKSRAAGCRA